MTVLADRFNMVLKNSVLPLVIGMTSPYTLAQSLSDGVQSHVIVGNNELSVPVPSDESYSQNNQVYGELDRRYYQQRIISASFERPETYSALEKVYLDPRDANKAISALNNREAQRLAARFAPGYSFSLEVISIDPKIDERQEYMVESYHNDQKRRGQRYLLENLNQRVKPVVEAVTEAAYKRQSGLSLSNEETELLRVYDHIRDSGYNDTLPKSEVGFQELMQSDENAKNTLAKLGLEEAAMVDLVAYNKGEIDLEELNLRLSYEADQIYFGGLYDSIGANDVYPDMKVMFITGFNRR
jgi:hypothetical protein